MAQIKHKIARSNAGITFIAIAAVSLPEKRMLSPEEKKFVEYWESHRLSEKKLLKQWLVGLPLGMAFAIPIVINFFSGWYKRAKMDINSQISNHEFNPLVLIISILLIISFMAIFSKRHRWEMNEQRYKELKHKESLMS